MKLKKVMALVLTGLMTAGMMAGCASAPAAAPAAAEPAAAVEEAAEEVTEAAEEVEEAAEEAVEETTEAVEEVTEEAAASEIGGDLHIIHYLTETAKLAALDGLVEGFKAEYPDVNLTVEGMSMDNYSDVIKLRYSTGEAPDVIFGQPKSYIDLIDNGLIMDLSGQEFVDRLAPASLTSVTVNDGVYGVPLDQMANVVFYNKDIFEEQGLSVPTTYTEFIDTCKALKEAGITPCAAGYGDDIAFGANWYTIYYGSKWDQAHNNAQELMEGASFHDYPGYTEALEQWREILNNYQNDDRKTIDTARAEQLFANGETGMIIIGTWGLGAIMDYNPDGNFGGFTYPSEENADDCMVPVAIDDCWMVNEDSANKDAALAFLEYASRAEVNSNWCGTASQLSALNGVECDTLPAAAVDIANEIATKKTTAWASVSNFNGQFSTVYTNVNRDFALNDDMTPAEWCDAMDEGFASARK